MKNKNKRMLERWNNFEMQARYGDWTAAAESFSKALIMGSTKAEKLYDKKMDDNETKYRILSISQGKCNNSDLGRAIF